MACVRTTITGIKLKTQQRIDESVVVAVVVVVAAAVVVVAAVINSNSSSSCYSTSCSGSIGGSSSVKRDLQVSLARVNGSHSMDAQNEYTPRPLPQP